MLFCIIIIGKQLIQEQGHSVTIFRNSYITQFAFQLHFSLKLAECKNESIIKSVADVDVQSFIILL